MEFCFICKAELNKNHNHYGSNSACHSCRAFFMRSVRSKKFGTFQHRAEECVIDSKTRKSCKKCRFDACLQAGMKVSYVQHQNLEKSSTVSNLNQEIKLVKILSTELQIEEEQFLNNLCDTVKRTETQIIFDIYVKNIQLICPQLLNMKYVHTTKEIELFYRLDKFVHKQLVHTLGKQINSDDINELFEHNYGRFRAFQYAIWFNDELIRTNYANELLDHAIKDDTVHGDAKDIFIQMAKSEKMTRSSYVSFFDSPWANSAEIEIEHWKLHQVIITDFLLEAFTKYVFKTRLVGGAENVNSLQIFPYFSKGTPSKMSI